MTAVDHAEIKRVEGEGKSPVYTAAYDTIRKGAPGLSDATCSVLAVSINMKVAIKVTAPLLSEIEGLKAERAIDFDRDGDKIILPKIFSAELIGRFMWGAAFEAARELAEGRPFKSFDQAFSECEPAQSLRTHAPDRWRPIEAAPKDGTNFDSQDRTNYGKRVFTKTHWYVHPSVQGWVTDEIDCGDYEFEPTHWRPSALRPQTAESGK